MAPVRSNVIALHILSNLSNGLSYCSGFTKTKSSSLQLNKDKTHLIDLYCSSPISPLEKDHQNLIHWGIPLLSNTFHLLLGNPEVLPGQIGSYIISSTQLDKSGKPPMGSVLIRCSNYLNWFLSVQKRGRSTLCSKAVSSYHSVCHGQWSQPNSNTVAPSLRPLTKYNISVTRAILVISEVHCSDNTAVLR